MKKAYVLLVFLVLGLYSLTLKALPVAKSADATAVLPQGHFKIMGTVTDEFQNPIINASLLIKELQIGAVTDNDGQYVLQRLPNGNYTLEVRFLGKKTEVKKIVINNSDNTLNVTLYNRNEELEEVTIEGFRNRDVTSKLTTSVSKMPLKALEAPQVYSSLSKEVLKNQLIYTVDDAYRNITGLQKMWSATNRAGDGGSFVNLRGFITNNSMRNGLVAPVTTSIDAINIEKLEVLKGPSATLFGSTATSYGGVINRVTKKPYGDFGGEVALIGGSFNHYRVQADVNGPLTNDKKLLFRVNTAYTNSGSFQKKDAENSFFAFIPSLTYNVNAALDINLELEMFDTDAVPDQFFFYLSPALGVNNMNDVEKLGVDYKNSYMGDGLKTKAKVRNLFGQVNYRINDRIRSSTQINSAYSYSDGFNPYFYLAPKSMVSQDPADTEMGVIRSDQSTVNSKEKYFQIQQNFNLDFDLGGMKNRTVGGFDYLRNESDQMFIFLGAFDWVPFRGGNYSTMNSETVTAAYNVLQNTPGYDFDASNTWPSTGVLNTYSGYISDVLTPTQGLNIMASIRYESNNFKGGKTGQSDTPAYEQAEWSPKFGIVYEIIRGRFSVFGNYQNSFTSNGYYLTNNSGDFALSDPEKANQWESGLKTDLIDGKVTATLSYYTIDVKNSLLNTGEYVGAQAIRKQAGSLTSKGVELEVNAHLLRGFSFIGGISYNDSEYTSTDELDANVYGRRPATASSPWLVNFNSSYQFQNGTLKGLGLGIGGNYASDNKIVNSNSEGVFILPEYFVLNVNAFYDLKKFRLGVRVDNLTNEHYWIGYTTGNPQATLNAVGSIAYKF